MFTGEEPLMKYMTFLIKDGELLESYNKNWDEVCSSMKKEFNNEPVYTEKYLKSKTKFYYRKAKTNFQGSKIPKEGAHCIFYQLY